MLKLKLRNLIKGDEAMVNVGLDLQPTHKIDWCEKCGDYTEHKRDGEKWVCMQHFETSENKGEDEKCQNEA